MRCGTWQVTGLRERVELHVFVFLQIIVNFNDG